MGGAGGGGGAPWDRIGIKGGWGGGVFYLSPDRVQWMGRGSGASGGAAGEDHVSCKVKERPYEPWVDRRPGVGRVWIRAAAPCR